MKIKSTGILNNNVCERCGVESTNYSLCPECYVELYEAVVEILLNGEVPSPSIFDFDDTYCSKNIKAHSELHDRKTHAGICSELNETYRKKNNDYGNSFKKSYDEFGIVSAVVRMTDKMERLKSLTTGTKSEIKDESIEDTILDLCNYGIMTVIEMRNRR